MLYEQNAALIDIRVEEDREEEGIVEAKLAARAKVAAFPIQVGVICVSQHAALHPTIIMHCHLHAAGSTEGCEWWWAVAAGSRGPQAKAAHAHAAHCPDGAHVLYVTLHQGAAATNHDIMQYIHHIQHKHLVAKGGLQPSSPILLVIIRHHRCLSLYGLPVMQAMQRSCACW